MDERRAAGSEPSLRSRLVRAVVLSPVFILILDVVALVLFYLVVGPAIPIWIPP